MEKHGDYILIIGTSSDQQLRLVIEKLEKTGVAVVLIDHDATRSLSLDFRKDGIELTVEGRRLPAPALVWSRLKIRSVLSSWTPETVPEYLRRAEWRGFLLGLAFALGDRVIGPVWAADFKVHQMAVASRVGLRLPASRVVLGREAALDFLQRDGDLVTKPIDVKNLPNLGANPDSYTLLTPVQFTPEDVESADAEEFSACPLLLQHRVRRGEEYRVIGFPDRSFCYRVRGRIENRMRVEDRAINLHVYDTIATPAELETKVAAYLREMGLEYGAFDFLKEDDGDLLFLECNPEGQWVAANGINHHEVAEHFAAQLVNRAFGTARAADAVAGRHRELNHAD